MAWLSGGAVLHADETGVRCRVALRHGEKGTRTRAAQGGLVVDDQLPTLLTGEGLHALTVERRREVVAWQCSKPTGESATPFDGLPLLQGGQFQTHGHSHRRFR